jgi:protein phosphatase
MNKIKFRIAAWSDAAGRPVNEDCFLVGKDLATEQWKFDSSETTVLGRLGALMVVCDGMGGTNAGEVASALAVDTLKAQFAADRLTDEIIASPESIEQYITDSIVAADRCIKQEAKADSAKAGMGSTLVMAWLLDGKVHVGWCGDSRVYRFNSVTGLQRLSHDHSYVQELVDAGKLSAKMAHRHPNSNIITRSLGDSGSEAQPDVYTVTLCRDDIYLLCSDGLCGILADDKIETIVRKQAGDLLLCRDTLRSESEKIGWTDNLTLILCRITSGGAKPELRLSSETLKQSPGNAWTRERRRKTQPSGRWAGKRRRIFVAAILLVAALAVAALAWFKWPSCDTIPDPTTPCIPDTIEHQEVIDPTESPMISETISHDDVSD